MMLLLLRVPAFQATKNNRQVPDTLLVSHFYFSQYWSLRDLGAVLVGIKFFWATIKICGGKCDVII
jgi:hypothetical protein